MMDLGELKSATNRLESRLQTVIDAEIEAFDKQTGGQVAVSGVIVDRINTRTVAGPAAYTAGRVTVGIEF